MQQREHHSVGIFALLRGGHRLSHSMRTTTSKCHSAEANPSSISSSPSFVPPACSFRSVTTDGSRNGNFILEGTYSNIFVCLRNVKRMIVGGWLYTLLENSERLLANKGMNRILCLAPSPEELNDFKEVRKQRGIQRAEIPSNWSRNIGHFISHFTHPRNSSRATV